MVHCPGQDQQMWKPDDIFSISCPICGYEIEFWKDDPFRICNQCYTRVCNPKMDLGCAKWCKHGDTCLDAINNVRPHGHNFTTGSEGV